MPKRPLQTKNIAFEEETFRPTKSKHPTHFCRHQQQPTLPQNPNHGNPPAIYIGTKNLVQIHPPKSPQKQLDFVEKPLFGAVQSARLLEHSDPNFIPDDEKQQHDERLWKISLPFIISMGEGRHTACGKTTGAERANGRDRPRSPPSHNGETTTDNGKNTTKK